MSKLQKKHENCREKKNDGFRWRCMKKKCEGKELSIRKGSKFMFLRTPLQKIIQVIYEWSRNTKIKRIIEECETPYKQINAILRVIRKSLREKKIEKIGGENCVVEIDETAVTKRKFDRGRKVAALWCVGGVCRVHKTFFFHLTDVRTKEVLHKIVKENVNEASTVITDEWRSYIGLNNFFKAHLTIKHKSNFVDPENPFIHTQTIESLWKQLKQYTRLYGSNLRKNISEYIKEYKFKNRVKDIFEKICAFLAV